jgi:hypothetical protein
MERRIAGLIVLRRGVNRLNGITHLDAPTVVWLHGDDRSRTAPPGCGA